MKKIRLHPTFILLGIFMAVTAKFRLFALSVIAVLIHEYVHYRVAKERGYTLTKLTLMPYGAVIGGGNNVYGKDLVIIAAVGPATNLLIAVVLIAFWWLYPSSYYYTLNFVKINCVIAFFNLLPCYPLDGARIIIGLSKNKPCCLKIMRVLGVAVSMVAFGLYIASAFFTINYNLAITAIMLYLGATAEADKGELIQIFNEQFFLKDLSRPLIKCELFVHQDTSLNRVIRSLKPTCVYTVNVVDNSLKTLFTLNNNDLEQVFCRNDRYIPIGKLNNKKNPSCLPQDGRNV